jgi:hypothetical protein
MLHLNIYLFLWFLYRCSVFLRLSFFGLFFVVLNSGDFNA